MFFYLARLVARACTPSRFHGFRTYGSDSKECTCLALSPPVGQRALGLDSQAQGEGWFGSTHTDDFHAIANAKNSTQTMSTNAKAMRVSQEPQAREAWCQA